MRGKRVFTDWHHRACAGKTIPRSCNGKRNFENIVLIDVDCDDFDDVIIIDAPESVQEKLQGAGVPQKNRRFPYEGVIRIDDDDDNGDVERPGPSVVGGGELDSDATSSRRSSPSSNLGESVDSEADECCVVPDEFSALKSSRSKNSSSGEGEVPCRNRDGLSPVSEDVSLDSDFSDCEVMEDPSGKLREQWENAFSKRKHDTFNGHFHSEDQVKAGLHTDACTSGEDHHSSNPVCSSSRNAKAKENFSSGDRFPVNLGVTHDHEEPSSLSREDRANRQNNTVGKEYKCKGKSCFDNITPARDIPDESDQGGSIHKEESASLKSNIGSETSADGERDNQAVDGLQIKCFSGNNSVPDELGHERTGPDKEILSGKSASILQSHEERDCSPAQDGDFVPSIQKDIINGREMLKETEEYKRAVEEEWASRQRQLQLQAEEAHRLRKKRRAETKRLLDMERRQRQRIEEMRQTQKKDEENMNLKEQLRAEIRKEISELEITCNNMASLLRGLGIPIGGSLCPLPQEVHAAYRRALLKFHPDRASRNDIRQEVEAEEKFKLLARMKEKFKWT
ncbi:hypothetical protein BT93_G1728 [Corymbia citriodora subsp. variegata]|nr:hypothetical protein BT93_G1728 [Corymbia citriodora subsp. variegata]